MGIYDQYEVEQSGRITRMGQRLDDLIKHGNVAAQGPKGDRGDQGPSGKDGQRGQQGPIGQRGAIGMQGPHGLNGKNGVDGLDGLAGATGATGAVGSIGKTGPVGPEGPSGRNGINGKDGTDGTGVQVQGSAKIADILAKTGAQHGDMWIATDDNSTASEPGTIGDGYTWSGSQWINVGKIRGQKGDAGPTGLQGPVGSQGPTGNNGLKGDKGEKGDKGAVGQRGPKGDQGIQGIQGVAGSDGVNGATGPQGLQGVKGDTGLTGPDGPEGKKGISGDDGSGYSGVYLTDTDPVKPGDPKKGDLVFQFYDKDGGTSPFNVGNVIGPRGEKGDKGGKGDAGLDGTDGADGSNGADGTNGKGLPVGGTFGQIITKVDGVDFNTVWTDIPNYIKADGTDRMDTGYVPKHDLDLATKSFVESSIKTVSPIKAGIHIHGGYTVTGFRDDSGSTKYWKDVNFNNGSNGAVTINRNWGDETALKRVEFNIPADGTYNIEWALNIRIPESSTIGIQIFVNGNPYDPIDFEANSFDNYNSNASGNAKYGLPTIITPYWSSVTDLKKGDKVTMKIRIIANKSDNPGGNPSEITFNRSTFRIELE